MAAKSGSAAFLETIRNRRTYYGLRKESPISDTQIQEIIKEVILHVPSAFNSQSSRILLLVKAEHDKLWDIAKEVLRGVVPAEQFASTEQKMDSFKAGYGTVLFFTDRPTVRGMQEKFALYADRFPVWAGHSDAMHQFAIWTALEAEGLGCSLQHYNPLIDEKVRSAWGVSAEWELSAQLVFGAPVGDAGAKAFLPVEGERFTVFGA